MSRFRNWCFTINNPEGLLVFDPEYVKACWYQEEVGESGTHHFQGYIEMLAPASLTFMKTMDGFETAHLERRRGTRQQAIQYCSKEPRLGGPYLYGSTDDLAGTGTRTDLEQFVQAAKDGLSFDQSFDDFPSIHAKYPRFVSSVYERLRNSQLPPIPTFVPTKPWQSELIATLGEQPDSRKIYWYYDQLGNAGKSYFANNFSCDRSYVVTPGKHADIVYAYRFEPFVFFDWPRDAQERFPYSVAESFKNGYFLSTKYEVRRVRFAVPHVIVFSNFEPDLTKLSIDRFEIKRL